MNYINGICRILKELKKTYPTWEASRHLSSLFADGDIWGMGDKQLFAALEEYQAKLAMDQPATEDISRIIKEGMDLENILAEDEDED